LRGITEGYKNTHAQVVKYITSEVQSVFPVYARDKEISVCDAYTAAACHTSGTETDAIL
jgi:hypothetical protein